MCCVLGILVCCVQQVVKGSVYRRTGYLHPGTRGTDTRGSQTLTGPVPVPAGPGTRHRAPGSRLTGAQFYSRHSPCTSEVGSPSSPVKFAWEKLGPLHFLMMPQHPLQTTPCGIHAGLTASVVSPVIAAANDIVYPPYLPLLQKLEQV